MPSGRDEEIAVIFREMRRASEMSPEQLSARLKTPAATIEALEAGDVAALPEWRETSRVVTAYAGFLGLDSRPILRRLKAHNAAGNAAGTPARDGGGEAPAPSAPSAEPPPAAPAGPPMPPGATRAPSNPAPAERAAPPDPRRAAAAAPPFPSAPNTADPAPPPRRETAPEREAGPAPGRRPERRRSGRLVTWLLLLVIFAAMGWGVRYAVGHPQLVWSGVDRLPEPGPRLVRAVWAQLRPLDVLDAGGARRAPDADAGGTTIAGGKADKAPGGRAPRDD